MGNRIASLAAAVMLLPLLLACGSVCSPTAAPAASLRLACVDIKAAHHAYVVVQHMSGKWIEECVGFGPRFIDAPTLMDHAGIAYLPRTINGIASACPIDGEPADGAACDSPGAPRWVLFVAAGGSWRLASLAFPEVQLADTTAIGWRYVGAGEQQPQPPPFPHEL